MTEDKMQWYWKLLGIIWINKFPTEEDLED